MNREIPYNEDFKCDNCGKKGCWDFMGDYLCEKCINNETGFRERVWKKIHKLEYVINKQAEKIQELKDILSPLIGTEKMKIK